MRQFRSYFWPITGFINWLWTLLPDKCTAYNCDRTGIRGNENWYNGKLVCDDCHTQLYNKRVTPPPIRPTGVVRTLR